MRTIAYPRLPDNTPAQQSLSLPTKSPKTDKEDVFFPKCDPESRAFRESPLASLRPAAGHEKLFQLLGYCHYRKIKGSGYISYLLQMMQPRMHTFEEGNRAKVTDYERIILIHTFPATVKPFHINAPKYLFLGSAHTITNFQFHSKLLSYLLSKLKVLSRIAVFIYYV